MPTNILMPALSPTMEKGNLAKWLKKEGDKVKSGDVIAEIETDKATMEVEAVDEGVLGQILVADGTENVAVNTPIAVILGDGEHRLGLIDPGHAVPPECQRDGVPTGAAAEMRGELGALRAAADRGREETGSHGRKSITECERAGRTDALSRRNPTVPDAGTAAGIHAGEALEGARRP